MGLLTHRQQKKIYRLKFSLIRKNQGQAVLELALLIPLLLLLVIGTLELGRIFFAKIVITNAAREGAYYLSLNPKDSSNSYTNTRQAVKDEANSSGLTLTDANITVSSPCCTAGQPAKVNVQTTIKNVLLVSLLAGTQKVQVSNGSITIYSSAQMVVQ